MVYNGFIMIWALQSLSKAVCGVSAGRIKLFFLAKRSLILSTERTIQVIVFNFFFNIKLGPVDLLPTISTCRLLSDCQWQIDVRSSCDKS